MEKRMETTMMEDQADKNMEHDMESGDYRD